MLEVRRLRLLRELKIRGTLAGVAIALKLSPSAVSQQLAQLEKEVGVSLLRKVGRRVQLTPQAEILIDHTSAVLDRIELAESDLTASMTTATGLVRTAVFQTAALALMPTALSLLSRDYPQLRVEMTQREPETALYETWARDFDLVVAEEYPGHAAAHFAELDRAVLTTDAIRLAVPESRNASVRSIEDVAALAWVMEPRGAASRHWAEQRCRQAGFEPDVRFETADLQAHVRLVESGNAVALLPDLVWTGRDVTVALIDLPDDPHRNIFTAARKSSANTPRIVACRKSLEIAAVGARAAAATAQEIRSQKRAGMR